MLNTEDTATLGSVVALDVQEWSFGVEYTVACGDCHYIRRYASKRIAENDQLTHKC